MAKKKNTPRTTPSQDTAPCQVDQRVILMEERIASLQLEVRKDDYSILDLSRDFPDDEAIQKLAETIRWAGGVRCPRCGSADISKVPNNNPMPYHCRDCRRSQRTKRYFSVITGTPMGSSGLSWQETLSLIYFIAAQHDGISAPQLALYGGVDQTSALDFRHRLQTALPDGGCHQFSGPSEFDESYLGGSESNRHKKDRRGIRGRQGKFCVLGAVDRDTRHVRLTVAEHADRKTLTAFVRGTSKPFSVIYSDGYCVYQNISGFWHEWVNHGAGEFVRGDVHINNVESLFNSVDRALYPLRGISKEHLPGHLREIQWLRNLSDRPVLVRMAVFLSFLLGVETPATDSTIHRPPGERIQPKVPASPIEETEAEVNGQGPSGENDVGATLLHEADLRKPTTYPLRKNATKAKRQRPPSRNNARAVPPGENDRPVQMQLPGLEL